jgi:uncharacterized protein (TIGR00290 family)
MNEPLKEGPKAWMSWSSGKDSAFCLYEVLRSSQFQVTHLLTTMNEEARRVSMHAVRDELLQKQADAIGIPLYRVSLPYPCSNEIYADRMSHAIEDAKSQGVTTMIFGDLFLEDVRAYRVEALKPTGLKAQFPLWKRDTSELAREMINSGQRAVITAVDPRKLSRDFVGREFNHSFLDALPTDVDPCGENGEFHSFVFDGPIFSAPIPIKVGQVVERDGFIFCDVSLDA